MQRDWMEMPIDTIISALIACTKISIATLLKRIHEIFLDINV
ncbi:MAG: hypothetical protein ACP5LV_05895 [Thermoplasmata archaeon]